MNAKKALFPSILLSVSSVVNRRFVQSHRNLLCRRHWHRRLQFDMASFTGATQQHHHHHHRFNYTHFTDAYKVFKDQKQQTKKKLKGVFLCFLFRMTFFQFHSFVISVSVSRVVGIGRCINCFTYYYYNKFQIPLRSGKLN